MKCWVCGHVAHESVCAVIYDDADGERLTCWCAQPPISTGEMLAKVSGWLRILTDGSPWAEDQTCIGCGRRQYRIEPPIGQGHQQGCAYIDAKAYLDAV